MGWGVNIFSHSQKMINVLYLCWSLGSTPGRTSFYLYQCIKNIVYVYIVLMFYLQSCRVEQADNFLCPIMQMQKVQLWGVLLSYQTIRYPSLQLEFIGYIHLPVVHWTMVYSNVIFLLHRQYLGNLWFNTVMNTTVGKAKATIYGAAKVWTTISKKKKKKIYISLLPPRGHLDICTLYIIAIAESASFQVNRCTKKEQNLGNSCLKNKVNTSIKNLQRIFYQLISGGHTRV